MHSVLWCCAFCFFFSWKCPFQSPQSALMLALPQTGPKPDKEAMGDQTFSFLIAYIRSCVGLKLASLAHKLHYLENTFVFVGRARGHEA